MIPALALGLAVSLVNVLLHCASLLALRRVLTHPHIRKLNYPNLFHLSLLMAATASILMVAHVVEIAIWGVTFHVLRVATSPRNALYDAFLSYTSLGFSLPPNHPWRLLEPISTLNGILLAGLSTAIMFQVLVALSSKNPR